MSDERPEALLKSALEKIVYFEARSEQLTRDLETARQESEALKGELAASAQREIDLRHELAEHQVQLARERREKEEAARVNGAFRQERAALIGKLVEASRIHGADRPGELEAEGPIDLASFISELRREALAPKSAAPAPAPVLALSVASVAEHAQRFQSEGRLAVTPTQMSQLAQGAGLKGRSEETLFGFSCRELSAPEPAARIRAAERLRSLGSAAAAPALASALHSEIEPAVKVALLGALAELKSSESAGVVAPHLTSDSAEVRIASLKALLSLDPGHLPPHLTAAMKDPDQTVRRRASLFALGLSGETALQVGEQAIADSDAQVRALAARVLGAAGGATARGLLQGALRDADVKVRQAAADGLSRILGKDVSPVVSLDEVQRRREVRKLAALPSVERRSQPRPEGRTEKLLTLARSLPAPAAQAPEAVCEQVCLEVRSAIRGRSTQELAAICQVAEDVVVAACELLAARGQLVRRGNKFFAG